MINVTDIKFRKFLESGALKTIVSVTNDDCLAVHDIKVVQGNDRLFVAMPSRKDETGIYRNIVHPIDSAANLPYGHTHQSSYISIKKQQVIIANQSPAVFTLKNDIKIYLFLIPHNRF